MTTLQYKCDIAVKMYLDHEKLRMSSEEELKNRGKGKLCKMIRKCNFCRNCKA